MIKTLLRWLLAGIYGFAGYAHIASPDGFLAITPDWVPWPEQVIFWTGIAEILGAIGLMIPRHILHWARPAAGIGLALYALCVFPANINHAINDIPLGGEHLSWWYHAPRLASQPIAILWALWVGEIVFKSSHIKR